MLNKLSGALIWETQVIAFSPGSHAPSRKNFWRGLIYYIPNELKLASSRNRYFISHIASMLFGKVSIVWNDLSWGITAIFYTFSNEIYPVNNILMDEYLRLDRRDTNKKNPDYDNRNFLIQLQQDTIKRIVVFNPNILHQWIYKRLLIIFRNFSPIRKKWRITKDEH